jgi:hypothetical protein
VLCNCMFDGRVCVCLPGGWIQAVLRSLLEPVSPKLQALDVKYSTNMEQDLMMQRYGITSAAYMQLRHIFLEACGGVGVSRAELSLSGWMSWVQSYLPPAIARIIFLSRVQSLKPVWRFSDFAEFVFLFGLGTVEDKFNSTVRFLLAGIKDHWSFVNVNKEHGGATDGEGENGQMGSVVLDETGASSQVSASASANSAAAPCAYAFTLKSFQQMQQMQQQSPSLREQQITASMGNSLFYSMLLFLGQSTDFKSSDILDPTSPVINSEHPSLNLNDITGSNVITSFTTSSSSSSLSSDSNVSSLKSPTSSVNIRWFEDFLGCVSGVKLPGEVQLAVDDLVDCPDDDESLSIVSNSDTNVTSGTNKQSLSTSNHDSDSGSLALADYAGVVIQYHRHFPVLKALSVVACCLFGLRPASPSLEKEYVMELLVKHYNDVPHSNVSPYGPAGSQWCVVSKAWYETWQFYVGNSRVRQMYALQREQEMLRKLLKKQRKRAKRKKNKLLLAAQTADPTFSKGLEPVIDENNPSDINNVTLPVFRQYTEDDLPPEPGAIDNWSILNKSGPIQIIANSVVGRDLELVPPSVYKALYCWYGGGPRIIRSVVVNPAGNNELELYPICLKACTCDSESGATDQFSKEYLFSRMATVHEVTQSLCDLFGLHRTPTSSPSSSPPPGDPVSPTSPTTLLNDPQQTPLRPLKPIILSHASMESQSSSFESANSNVRLWNITNTKVSEQYILSPELTLMKAGLADGQVVLVEMCVEGTWPRSHYQTTVCKENGEETEFSNDPNNNDQSGEGRDTISDSKLLSGIRNTLDFGGYFSGKNKPSLYEASQTNESLNRSSLATGPSGNTSNNATSPRVPVTPKTPGAHNGPSELVRNDGKVGLDNLGNTCYLNSSLQALLHTEPLVEYFCKQYHVRDVNRRSKHGYGGRLSHAFGRLLYELYTAAQAGKSTTNNDETSEVSSSTRTFRLRLKSPKSAHISPKKFYGDFTTLATQFRGHMQHDAQEVLAFLLDGLSEDLNLVTEKPYIEYPDSNDRPDSELAEIWWKNHNMRDNSVIQTLFSGQFKSIISCECKYTSARFEPFMFLTLPLPEETTRPITVYVMTLENSFALKCMVRLPRDATLNDVVTKLIAQGVPGISTKSLFRAGEVINSKVVMLCAMSRRVGTIRDADNVFLFEYQTPEPNAPSGSSTPVVTENSNNDNAGEQTPNGSSDTEQNDEVDQDYVSVVFVQRKATLSNGGGIKCYRMDSFGLPLVLGKSVQSSSSAFC